MSIVAEITEAKRASDVSDAQLPASTPASSTTPASTTPASTTPASTTPASTTPASTTPASTTPAITTSDPTPSEPPSLQSTPNPKPPLKKRTKFYICQVPGCGATIQKPWNHINQSKKHRQIAIEDKVMYKGLTLTIGILDQKESQVKRKPPPPQPNDGAGSMEGDVEVDVEGDVESDVEGDNSVEIHSTGRQRFGDTRSMEMFALDTPILVEYQAYLQSLAGGKKKEQQAKEMATDLSKFLHFTSAERAEIDEVIKIKAVDLYVEELRQLKIGPSGIISKLNVLCTAQTFLVHRMPDEPNLEQQSLANRCNITKVKTSAMKKGLAKEKNELWARKKEYVSLHKSPPEELTKFLNSQETFDEIVKQDPKAMIVRRFLMCYLLYTNFQRQGAVANMTAGEVSRAEKRDFRVIRVWDHKTSSTHGAARIAVNQRVYEILVKYMAPKSGADLVFTTGNGERVTHAGLELEKLGDYFGKKFTITPTHNRKLLATAVAKTGSEADVRATAKHMTHSLDVHRSSYQQIGDAADAVDRYILMNRSAESEGDVSPRRKRVRAKDFLNDSDSDDERNQAREDSGQHPSPPPSPHKKKRTRYTMEENALVMSFFDLEARETLVSSNECTAFLSEHQGPDMFHERTGQNIQDKVKTILRQKRKK